MSHLRSNLLLLSLTVVICCVLYPLTLYGVGNVLFPTATSGSLVSATGQDTIENATGSRLIAQPFTADEYFWPRPSAVSYNATASGGSNYGANNPKLRDRVAQQLGPMIQYRSGSVSSQHGMESRTPQHDIDAWFAAVPNRVATWAADSPTNAANWAKTDFANDVYGLPGRYILEWTKTHPDVRAAWIAANPDAKEELKPEDLAVLFFASFANVHPGKWPGIVDKKQPDGSILKQIEPVTSDPAIHANFFDLWLSDPANADRVADLEPVVADMVTTSGSGLDPHITVRNALSAYQLDRVAKKRAPTLAQQIIVKRAITELIRSKSFTPLSGLTGEPLVNVLELNIELDRRFPVPRTNP